MVHRSLRGDAADPLGWPASNVLNRIALQLPFARENSVETVTATYTRALCDGFSMTDVRVAFNPERT